MTDSRVAHDDDDPGKLLRDEQLHSGIPQQEPRDGLMGACYVEKVLTKFMRDCSRIAGQIGDGTRQGQRPSTLFMLTPRERTSRHGASFDGRASTNRPPFPQLTALGSSKRTYSDRRRTHL